MLAGLPFTHLLLILPPNVVGVVDSGVLETVPAGLVRPISGVIERARNLPPAEAFRCIGDEAEPEAIASLYLKYGDRPWRKATQIPVT